MNTPGLNPPRPRRGVTSFTVPVSSGQAFTLVELLVATTVTLLLVVVLVRVFNGAAGNWRHSEAQVDAYREARGALQLMARDLSATLQASYAQAGGGADSTTAITTGPMLPTLVLARYPGGPTYPDSPNNEEIYCLTNLSPNQGGNRGASSLCAVGYFCQWMADDSMFPVSGASDQRPRAFALMRQSLDSNGTFKRLAAKGTSTSPLDAFPDVYKRVLSYNAAAETPPIATVTPIASYIWDVRFRIDTDLNDSTVPDGDASGATGDHSNPQRFYDGSKLYPPLLPPYVEIRFKALSELAARRVEGINSGFTYLTWKDTTSTIYQQAIRPNYQQFILRVPLVNSSYKP